MVENRRWQLDELEVVLEDVGRDELNQFEPMINQVTGAKETLKGSGFIPQVIHQIEEIEQAYLAKIKQSEIGRTYTDFGVITERWVLEVCNG